MLLAAQIATEPIVALVVAAALFGLGRMVIHRVAFAEANPWLVRILTASLILHLLAAPTQIYVVDHVYNGIADWNRYTHTGAALAPNFRHFNFTTAGANVRQIVNDGSVSIATGIVMAIVGVNLTATFLVFSWLSFIGAIFFFRAFSLTFPGADHRRYAKMLFFLPSLIFWTADVSKESIMMFGLGLTAYGAAKFLARKPGGFVLVVPGVFISAYVRPNELLLILAGFAVAMMVPTAATRRQLGGVRRLISLVFLGGLLAIAVGVTFHYLHGGAGGSLSLQQTNANNQGQGLGFGSSGVPYSTNLITFPRDIYEVLFNPLPYNFHGLGELVAAGENTVVLVLIVMSYRNLRMVPRASFARPYVMLCLVYTGTFLYTFAALGNLGLIERERTMMLPFLLVLLSVPRAPKHRPPRYEWELRRRARLQLRAAAERSAPAGGSRPPRPAADPRVPPVSVRTRAPRCRPQRPRARHPEGGDRHGVGGYARIRRPGRRLRAARSSSGDSRPIQARPTASRLKCSTPRSRAARPSRIRSAPSSTRLAVAATRVSRSSPGTTKPVRSSCTIERTPGTAVATTGRPDRPASISTPGMPSPSGRLGNTMRSARRICSATSDREPSNSTPAFSAGRARASRKGPSPITVGPEVQAAGPQRRHHFDETIGSFARGEGAHEEHVGWLRRPAGCGRRRGWYTSGSRPLGVRTTLGRNPEKVDALVAHLLSLGRDHIGPSEQGAPQPQLRAPGRNRSRSRWRSRPGDGGGRPWPGPGT